MCSKLFNTADLVFAIIGTYFVFRWGLTLQSESYGLGLEDGTEIETKWGKISVLEARIKSEEERKRYLLLSRIGLMFIAIGFAFQTVATWIWASRTRPLSIKWIVVQISQLEQE